MSYVFLDGNLNVLNLQSTDSANYLNCILAKGYLQTIGKATRIQNDSKTLIDYVLSNSGNLELCSGTRMGSRESWVWLTGTMYFQKRMVMKHTKHF